MHYWNDGADGFLWEPLYRLKIGLTPCEQAVVTHPAFRRLQRIAHYGASARILPMTHTRYTHTIGVFALAAHFRPEDWTLRLAALLHDIGHLPFSHSAERALGIDHHDLTLRIFDRAGFGGLIRRHGLDAAAVLGALDGPNALVPGDNGLGLDHLDSFLRDTETCGIGETPAHLLLRRFSLAGPRVEAQDEATAREVVRRVAADHRLFLRPRCLALDALITQIFARAQPDPDTLVTLGDEEALTLAAATVPDLVDRLRNRPWSVAIREDDGGEGWPVAVNKLYPAQIRLGGRPVAEVLPEAAAVYGSLEQLKRAYKVTLT